MDANAAEAGVTRGRSFPRSAWECLKGRSASQRWKGTQSVPGCISTRSVGMIGMKTPLN